MTVKVNEDTSYLNQAASTFAGLATLKCVWERGGKVQEREVEAQESESEKRLWESESGHIISQPTCKQLCQSCNSQMTSRKGPRKWKSKMLFKGEVEKGIQNWQWKWMRTHHISTNLQAALPVSQLSNAFESKMPQIVWGWTKMKVIMILNMIVYATMLAICLVFRLRA